MQQENRTVAAVQIFAGIEAKVTKIARRYKTIGARGDIGDRCETTGADQRAARTAGRQPRRYGRAEGMSKQNNILWFSTADGHGVLPDRLGGLITSPLTWAAPAAAKSRVIDDR